MRGSVVKIYLVAVYIRLENINESCFLFNKRYSFVITPSFIASIAELIPSIYPLLYPCIIKSIDVTLTSVPTLSGMESKRGLLKSTWVCLSFVQHADRNSKIDSMTKLFFISKQPAFSIVWERTIGISC